MTTGSINRVIVGISGNLGNLAALHVAVAEARSARAPLLAVVAWIPTGGEVAYHRAPCPPLMDLWREHARATVSSAFSQAFGGLPEDLSISSVISRGETGPALVGLAGHPADLLVVGTGERGRLARLRHGSVSRYCLAHARCPVLAVPPPEMIDELRSRRGWRHAQQGAALRGASPRLSR